mmetsp:Transcript_15240/g.50049  ORF Transcript_15240/g.50049 Transcript_15240/m.50049 type:complete len:236 (-) Transcript_15240:26-733(-)
MVRWIIHAMRMPTSLHAAAMPGATHFWYSFSTALVSGASSLASASCLRRSPRVAPTVTERAKRTRSVAATAMKPVLTAPMAVWRRAGSVVLASASRRRWSRSSGESGVVCASASLAHAASAFLCASHSSNADDHVASQAPLTRYASAAARVTAKLPPKNTRHAPPKHGTRSSGWYGAAFSHSSCPRAQALSTCGSAALARAAACVIAGPRRELSALSVSKAEDDSLLMFLASNYQ